MLLDDISYKYNLHGDVCEELAPVDPPLSSEEYFGFFPQVTMGGALSAAKAQRIKLREHLHLLAEIPDLPTK